MRFLVDECTGSGVARWLRNQGYEVFSVFDEARGISDEKIIQKVWIEKLKLMEIIRNDPYQYPPEYELLKGDMKGLISRRINKQHRLVYEVVEQEKLIKIYRMWTHYE
ncbi:Txe/YoeB family addiction module toxin [Geminocystis sp. CENA526]|uniref:Txe/YoeB family addiction module toxin n=1 Tax=Geminocystis sp. CENA526 TaxID=1355871 RepID=UPI003D6F309B